MLNQLGEWHVGLVRVVFRPRVAQNLAIVQLFGHIQAPLRIHPELARRDHLKLGCIESCGSPSLSICRGHRGHSRPWRRRRKTPIQQQLCYVSIEEPVPLPLKVDRAFTLDLVADRQLPKIFGHMVLALAVAVYDKAKRRKLAASIGHHIVGERLIHLLESERLESGEGSSHPEINLGPCIAGVGLPRRVNPLFVMK